MNDIPSETSMPDDQEPELETGTANLEVQAETLQPRFDQFIATHFPQRSRSFFQNLIQGGLVTINGAVITKPGTRIYVGDRIEFTWPPQERQEPRPEAMPLSVVYEDASIMVIDKPAGLVVHPGEGNRDHTLVSGLMALHPECFCAGEWPDPERPGIVHRLDKDTSGLLVIAKTPLVQEKLQQMFKDRRTEKIYLAITWGVPAASMGRVENEIGRHPGNRLKRAVVSKEGKIAITHYRIRSRNERAGLVELLIETGRTHQIRVHLAHLRCPVAGDALYGGNRPHEAENPKRPMLHAWRLRFPHPYTGKRMEFISPIPADFAETAAKLKLNMPTEPILEKPEEGEAIIDPRAKRY
jgi:23S rRNA pseudouridine1911/1915/1917 synthase